MKSVCSYCSLTFENRKLLAEHFVVNHHWNEGVGHVQKCPVCFENHRYLSNHMKTKHSSNCFFCLGKLCYPHLECAELINEAFVDHMICYKLSQLQIYENLPCVTCSRLTESKSSSSKLFNLTGSL